MNTEKVVSREYKLVLQAKHFEGNEARVKKKAKAFWQKLKRAVQPVISSTQGTLGTINEKRKIKFYDTPNFKLHKHLYLLRERTQGKKRELTLKFRHHDRYVAQDRKMKPKGGSTKFEEDIKAPFTVLYSFSGEVENRSNKELKKFKDVIKFYPDLAKKIPYDSSGKMIAVNDLAINEIVINGAYFQLSSKPKLLAQCALIIWYDLKGSTTTPAIVEFSFRYGHNREKYIRKTSQKAYDLFKKIQSSMPTWLSADAMTKTDFVYATTNH